MIIVNILTKAANNLSNLSIGCATFKRQYSLGFTLYEVMIVLALAGVLLAIAFPTFREVIDNKRLAAPTESLYSDFKMMHSEAITRHSNLYVSFQAGPNWCYGMDNTGPCDCSIANDCQIDGVTMVVSTNNYTGVTATLNGFSTSADGISYVEFTGTRGIVTTGGNMTFTRSAKSARVTVAQIGRTEVCSNQLKEYKSCT